MSELPAYLSTSKWGWQRIHKPGHLSDGFWLGCDTKGNRWITKLRGPFYAYREILFSRLAQAMKWSCQSSLFIRLDHTSAKALSAQPGSIHAAHWLMEEHTRAPCGDMCALSRLISQNIRTIEDLKSSEIQHLLDWPKSHIAAYIFGGNEPPGTFFTTMHEFVVIDAEQMFSSNPSSFEKDPWLVQPDGLPSPGGKELAIQVCEDISRLPKELIIQALALPKEVQIKLDRPIEPILYQSINFATKYAQSHAIVR